MADLMGAHTKAKACHGKTKHPARMDAQRHLAFLFDQGASPVVLRVYRCRHCQGWHVGHVMPSTGRRRRR